MYDTEDPGAGGATAEGAAAAPPPATRSELRPELVHVTDALERRMELHRRGLAALSDLAYATSRQLVVLTKWLLACEADGSAARTARTPGGTP